jgi:Ca-activated chloride channel family protein
VELVTVGVGVTDSSGRDVRGLTQRDFSVYEDGIQQTIAHFSNEPAAMTVGILFDSSASMQANEKIERAKDAARALVAGVRTGSEFYFIDFDDRVKVVESLTADRQKIDSAIDQAVAEGGTSLYDAILQGLDVMAQSRLPRQTIVVISDGADQHSTHKLKEMLDTVRDSRTQIYTIGYFSKEEEALYRDPYQRFSRPTGEKVDNPRLALEKIAKDSGGKSFFPKSDRELTRSIAEITEDLRTQYTIGFYPNPLRPNAYHELKVSVRGGRYTVRTRPGYVEPGFPLEQ